MQYYLEIICNTSIYAMDHPELIVSNFKENSFDLQRVKIETLDKISVEAAINLRTFLPYICERTAIILPFSL